MAAAWGKFCRSWLNVGIFLLGVSALLGSDIYLGIKGRYHGIMYLLLVPLVLGNLDTGQANPTDRRGIQAGNLRAICGAGFSPFGGL